MPPCCASGGLLKYEGRVEQELAASTENQKGKAVEMIRYDKVLFYGKIVIFFHHMKSVIFSLVIT